MNNSNIEKEQCCHFPNAGHCWHCEKVEGGGVHLKTCPWYKPFETGDDLEKFENADDPKRFETT